MGGGGGGRRHVCVCGRRRDWERMAGGIAAHAPTVTTTHSTYTPNYHGRPPIHQQSTPARTQLPQTGVNTHTEI